MLSLAFPLAPSSIPLALLALPRSPWLSPAFPLAPSLSPQSPGCLGQPISASSDSGPQDSAQMFRSADSLSTSALFDTGAPVAASSALFMRPPVCHSLALPRRQALSRALRPCAISIALHCSFSHSIALPLTHSPSLSLPLDTCFSLSAASGRQLRRRRRRRLLRLQRATPGMPLPRSPSLCLACPRSLSLALSRYRSLSLALSRPRSLSLALFRPRLLSLALPSSLLPSLGLARPPSLSLALLRSPSLSLVVPCIPYLPRSQSLARERELVLALPT